MQGGGPADAKAVRKKTARLPMRHARAVAKNSAGMRLRVVEKIMLPHCILQRCFVFVLRMLLKKQFAMRALRRDRQSVRRKRACARRDTPTYRCCSPQRPSKEPSQRVETPWLITMLLTNSKVVGVPGVL